MQLSSVGTWKFIAIPHSMPVYKPRTEGKNHDKCSVIATQHRCNMLFKQGWETGKRNYESWETKDEKLKTSTRSCNRVTSSLNFETSSCKSAKSMSYTGKTNSSPCPRTINIKHNSIKTWGIKIFCILIFHNTCRGKIGTRNNHYLSQVIIFLTEQSYINYL